MKKISYVINRYVSAQVKFCNWMLLLLGIMMTILILMQVFFRFVIYVPFPWSEECARYLMIWMGMLGSVVALKNGRHIGVQFFIEKLPGRVRDIMVPLVQLCMIIFLSVLCWQGVQFSLLNLDQLSPAMEISMLIPFGAIPVGSFMMIFVIVGDIFQAFSPADADADLQILSGKL